MMILEYQLKDVYIFIGATNAQKKKRIVRVNILF